MVLDINQNKEALKKATNVMRLLSNPHRLSVLCYLGEGEIPVGTLAEMVEMSPSALSQHLAKLKKSGLVASRREHNKVFYRLENEEIVAIIRLLKELYCSES